MMKNALCSVLAFSIINLCFIFELPAQTLGFSQCLDENDAFIGLDRKGWTSQVSNLSESYQLDFEIPDPTPLDCHKVSFINVSISFDETLNNIPPNCIAGFWTHALLCDSNDPIDCPNSSIVYDQGGLNTSFTINEEIENGQNLGIDIVVLINVQDPTCDPSSISAGLFEADIEICIDVFYEELQPEMEVDLGDDIIICPGQTIDIDGPNGFDTYEWDGPIDSDERVLEDAIPGVYTLDAYDDLGCKSSDVIEIIADGEINVSFNSNNPLDICLGSDFIVSPIINSVENNLDFDYQWTLPDNTNTSSSSISITQSGIYTLEVTDNDTGCTATSELVVQETNISQAQIDSISLPQVNICENGSIELTAFVSSLDLNNYAFEWIIDLDTTRTQTITINQPGEYILIMYNQIGCPSSSDTIIVEEVIPLSAGESNNTTICSGENFDLNTLLSIDASMTGDWFDNNNNIISGGIFSSSISNDIINITYLVTNDSPCQDETAFFTIFVNDESIDAGDDMTTQICSNETINLNGIPNGDIGGDFYNSTFDVISNQTIEAENLNSGINTFYYIVSGGSCGQDTSNININVIEEILPTLIEGPFCILDEIIVGSEVFNISNPIGRVTLTSINNCDSLVDINMTFFEEAENSITQTYCSTETITIGGQDFNSLNDSDTITLNGGSINGCDSIINVNLNFVDAVEAFFDQQLCEGESIVIGGQIFDESSSSDIITLTNGSSLGCDSILNVDIMFTSVVIENITETLCQGEQIIINGEVFDESNQTGQQDFTSVLGCDSLLNIELAFLEISDMELDLELCVGDEIIINGEIFNDGNLTSQQTLLNSVGCDSIVNVTINLIPISTNTILNTFCVGESIIIEGEVFDASNTNGELIIENGSSTSCDSVIIVDLIFLENINIDVTNDLCIGDSILIDGVWEFDTGTYQEAFTSSQGCDSIITYQLIFNNCEINIELDVISNISCFGNDDGEIEITLIGDLSLPYTYEVINILNNTVEFTGQVTTENLTLTNLSAIEYAFNLTSSSGDLINTAQIILSQPDELNINVAKDDILCIGDPTGNLILNVTGGTQPYEYLWSNGSTESMISELTSGSYSYTVTDTNGCASNGSISIVEPDIITANLNVSNANCETTSDGTIEVLNVSGGTPDYNFSIGGYNFTPNNIFEELINGAYQVFVTDSNGCIEQFDTTVSVESLNTIDVINDITITQGDSVSLIVSLDFVPSNVEWISLPSISCNDCLAPIFTPTTTTTYNIQIEDEFGCVIEQSFTINVLIPNNDQVFVPTVFTPGDQTGGNDIFKPFFSPEANVDFLNLNIYDRWGNLIYTESNELIGWDGRSKNRSINQGVYVYVINYIDNNGNETRIVGDITLLR